MTEVEEAAMPERELLRDAWGALNFILAFYEPGQRHLDTNAWKQAEASGRRVRDRLAAAIAAIDESRARDKGDEQAAYIVRFDDKGVEDVTFAGYGATEAALKYFEVKQASWNCHLFKRIAGPNLQEGLAAPAPSQSDAIRAEEAKRTPPTPFSVSMSDSIRAEVIAQGVDPNSDKAERMGRAIGRNMLRKAEGKG